MKVKLGIEFSCAGVLPEVRRVQVVIILVIVLLAWPSGGAPILQTLTDVIRPDH